MKDRDIKVPKALQKDVVFFGLKAKYVEKATKGVVVCLVIGLICSTFMPGWIAGVGSFGLAGGFVSLMLYYSKAYGDNGFVKKQVDKKLPDEVKGYINKKNLLIWNGK